MNSLKEMQCLVNTSRLSEGLYPYYQDELCTIINDDIRNVAHLLPKGTIITDPPYNIGYHYEGYKDKLTDEEYHELIKIACPQPSVIIHYVEDLCAFSWLFESVPEKIVAWVYPSNTARQWRGIAWFGCMPDFKKDGQEYRNPNDKRIQERIMRGEKARLYDWWEVNQVKNIGNEKTEHPCQIPEEVISRILKITDCKLVIDPFLGSGTTIAVAKKLGIPSIGIEKNINYCEIAAKRVAQEMVFDFS